MECFQALCAFPSAQSLFSSVLGQNQGSFVTSVLTLLSLY